MVKKAGKELYKRSFGGKILAGSLFFLMVFVSLAIAGHNHHDFDHHDCPICLLGVMPCLGVGTILFLILWIRLDSVFSLAVLIPKRLSSPAIPPRSPPLPAWQTSLNPVV